MIARPLAALVRTPSGSVGDIFLSAAISRPTNKSSSSRLKTLHISQHGAVCGAEQLCEELGERGGGGVGVGGGGWWGAVG